MQSKVRHCVLRNRVEWSARLVPPPRLLWALPWVGARRKPQTSLFTHKPPRPHLANQVLSFW